MEMEMIPMPRWYKETSVYRVLHLQADVETIDPFLLD